MLEQFKSPFILFTLILLHLLPGFVTVRGQKSGVSPRQANPAGLRLSTADSLALAGLPVLEAAAGQLKTTLPPVHDNAGQPYFMPYFEQVSNECGQYAGISMVFAYEMNRARGTSAALPANQYPTHYTYNFMNGGYGWYGSSYMHSFEVARVNGHPSVADFGTMNSCGPSHWMTGYQKYRSGMSNKLEQVYQIPAGTPDGLLVLKNWLHNHLAGSESGSIACFYSSTPWNLKLLPPGTPEGGKHVITNWLTPAGHASTICGWNDSIRFDYNQDGQYTNHIDINGDGTVDMRDWEIGGLRFTDSYIDGTNWADSGFAYMMYKSLADSYGDGGIWNNAVHVVTVREDYEPLLSMKVTLEHNCRNRIRILAGASGEATGSVGHTMGFPIFNFQGGCQHLQGGYEPGARTLELGLDITPLLAHLRPGEEGAVFLILQEDDPDNQGTGKIVSLSVIDHMHDDQEWPLNGSNVPIQENGVTVVGIPLTLDFDDLQVATQSLPAALTGEEYLWQMEAAGGEPPYSWKMVRHFSEVTAEGSAPPVEAEAVPVSDTLHGLGLKVLDFEFPFFGEAFDSVWVHTDGFIMFDGQTYPWPYLYDEELMIRRTRLIAPCLNYNLRLAEGDGIWYAGDETRAAFRWKATALQPAGKTFEFALELFPGGEIRFYHTGEAFIPDHTWAAGLSAGDGTNFQVAGYTSQVPGPGGHVTTFTPQPYPEGISLSETGALQGATQENFPGMELMFEVTDATKVSRRKALPFHSYHAGVEEPALAEGGEVRAWPVPAAGQLHLELELTRPATLTFELCDLAGTAMPGSETARYPAGRVRHTLDLAAAAPGTYLLKVRTGGLVLGVRKVIIMNTHN